MMTAVFLPRFQLEGIEGFRAVAILLSKPNQLVFSAQEFLPILKKLQAATHVGVLQIVIC